MTPSAAPSAKSADSKDFHRQFVRYEKVIDIEVESPSPSPGTYYFASLESSDAVSRPIMLCRNPENAKNLLEVKCQNIFTLLPKVSAIETKEIKREEEKIGASLSALTSVFSSTFSSVPREPESAPYQNHLLLPRCHHLAYLSFVSAMRHLRLWIYIKPRHRI